MQMRRIPKFTLSRPGDSIVDMNARIDFPEESMTMPQNCSDIWLHIMPFTSPAIYERKKSSNDQPSRSAQSARRKCFAEILVHERRVELRFGCWIWYSMFNVVSGSDSNSVKACRRQMNSQRSKWTGVRFRPHVNHFTGHGTRLHPEGVSDMWSDLKVKIETL
jgi:hypothetical protein